jgi:hypothetical protein
MISPQDQRPGKAARWRLDVLLQYQHKSAMLGPDNALRGCLMNADDLHTRLLTSEVSFLQDQIIKQLCRWERCRHDSDLRMALSTVHELVQIEDSVMKAFP